MKGKNYHYSKSANQNTSLDLIKTPEMLHKVLMIDQGILQDVLKNQESLLDRQQGYRGKCPFCYSCKSQSRQSDQSHKPAYLIPGSVEGYIFHCCACKVSLPVYKFLKESHGIQSAEEYAERRWEAGELCGAGWNCPLPQKIRDRLLSEKAQRREEYRRAEQERKARNYQRKYGSSSTESD